LRNLCHRPHLFDHEELTFNSTYHFECVPVFEIRPDSHGTSYRRVYENSQPFGFRRKPPLAWKMRKVKMPNFTISQGLIDGILTMYTDTQLFDASVKSRHPKIAFDYAFEGTAGQQCLHRDETRWKLMFVTLFCQYSNAQATSAPARLALLLRV